MEEKKNNVKAIDFINEVRSSDLCPEDFDKIYSRFQKYQEAAIRTLREFHRVCEKNGIHYQLAYGSLLGAIRDGGQIPWDYDIDVVIPYYELPALVDALKRDLDDGFYFYCPEIDSRCRHFMIRLAPKGYRTEALHVDVFYLIGVPEDPDGFRAFAEDMRRTLKNRYYKLVRIYEQSEGNPKKIAYLLYKRMMTMFRSVDSLTDHIRDMCNKYPLADAKRCSVVASFIYKRSFSTDDLMDTELITIDTGTFYVPKRAVDILTNIYGKDYGAPPPLKSRVEEMLRFYHRLEYFHKNIDI